MKLILLLLTSLSFVSCSSIVSETKYTNRGTNDEEKMYFRVIDDYKLGNFMGGYGCIKAFERKFPDSKFLCEVLSYKGDSHIQHEYYEAAITDYEYAKSKCLKSKETNFVKILDEKIAKAKVSLSHKK